MSLPAKMIFFNFLMPGKFCARFEFGRLWFLMVAVAVLSFGMSGCGDVNNASRGIAALRVMDASPDAGGLDIYSNATALTYNVGFGTVSSYIAFTPGTYTLAAKPAGTQTVLTSTRASILQGVQYTLLVGNVAAGLQTQLLQDQGQPAPSGQVAMRFIDQVTRTRAVDVYLVPQGGTLLTAAPVMAGLMFNSAANPVRYVNVPAGPYALMVLPAGTVPVATTLPSYAGAMVSYPGGSARTFIVLDQPLAASPGVQVITASDYDLAAATS